MFRSGIMAPATTLGDVAEWFKAAVLITVDCNRSMSSYLRLSPVAPCSTASSDTREIGRVVECTGLENRRTLIAYPGFESLVSRQITPTEPAFWRALLFLGCEKCLYAETIVSASFGIVSATPFQKLVAASDPC